jgi:hypothetical protein
MSRVWGVYVVFGCLDFSGGTGSCSGWAWFVAGGCGLVFWCGCIWVWGRLGVGVTGHGRWGGGCWFGGGG